MALNPNNKIPVLVDDDVVVSESGAILIYLAEKTGKLLPKEPRARIKTIEMVINQMASLGPMLVQPDLRHQPADTAATDLMAVTPQMANHLAAAIPGHVEERRVDHPLQRQHPSVFGTGA
jgi:glutathione S-transferase